MCGRGEFAMSEKIGIDSENSYRFLHLLLNMGEDLLLSGAEINRVEDTLNEMACSYGVKELNVFVIPSVITATIRLYNGFELTQTRRINTSKIGTNLLQLEKLNDISHNCKKSPFPLEELEKQIKDSNDTVPTLPFCLGSALASGGFCVFFGGTVLDGIVSALFAMVVCFFQRFFAKRFPNRVFLTFICAFLIGVLVGAVAKFFPVLSNDKIIIGDIMLLIPGIALTVSLRDIMLGDTVSGSLRLVDSLCLTGALALGFWMSFAVVGGML